MAKRATTLNDRQMKFVAELLRDPKCNAAQAAVRAGYSPKSAKYRARELMNESPAVVEKLAELRAAVARDAQYDAATAMAELRLGMQEALRKGQLTAYARCVELRAKLTGVLRDKLDVDVKVIDISENLRAARARVHAIDVPFRVLGESPAIPALLPTLVGEPSIFE